MHVYVVDDDTAITESVRFMLSTLKLSCRTFESGEVFLTALPHLPPGCVILDMDLGGLDGLTVHREIVRRGTSWPVIFLTGECSVPLIVQAMQQGAVEFIAKPSTEKALLDALHKASQHAARQEERSTECDSRIGSNEEAQSLI